jgi:hypothetical protein
MTEGEVVLQMGTSQYSQVRPAVARSDLTTIAPYMFWLMFRNIASDGSCSMIR